MEARADLLRRQIALYLEYLRLGVNGGTAMTYLQAIAEAEAELAKHLECLEVVEPPSSPQSRR
jgi:hypothetical protein